MVQKFCFCTLAVGQRYRTHAKMLAKDIKEQAPNMSLLILTDRPADFEDYPNVIAIKHRLQSVKGYHDKRFVLEQALERVDMCIFVDSDVRIIGSVPEDLDWPAGITARTGCNILNHFLKHKDRTEIVGKVNKELSVVEQAAQKFDINLEEVKWFHEFMFVVKKQAGVEKKFFELWQTISYFFEMQGIYHGEGYVMGLAASKTGLTIGYDRTDWFPFFKDNIERVRIKNQQSNIVDNQVYFDTHKEIEYPKRPIWKKAINKLKQKLLFYYRVLRLRRFIKKYPNFQQFQ